MLPGFLAEALAVTPTVTQGPYYPLADDIPLDKDNDLVRLNDSLIHGHVHRRAQLLRPDQ